MPSISRRPHIANTGRVKAFTTTKNSASLWLGKQGNDQLQRVYGISFPDKKEMTEWKHLQERRTQSDHPLPPPLPLLPPLPSPPPSSSPPPLPFAIALTHTAAPHRRPPPPTLTAPLGRLQEEAAKRDHRKIGLEQELFYFDELSPAARSKCPSWQCPGSAPSPPQGTTPGGSGQFLTPRARPNH